jgi:hypothetical protein
MEFLESDLRLGALLPMATFVERRNRIENRAESNRERPPCRPDALAPQWPVDSVEFSICDSPALKGEDQRALHLDLKPLTLPHCLWARRAPRWTHLGGSRHFFSHSLELIGARKGDVKGKRPKVGYAEGNAMGLVSAITFTLLGSLILLRWMEASLRKG